MEVKDKCNFDSMWNSKRTKIFHLRFSKYVIGFVDIVQSYNPTQFVRISTQSEKYDTTEVEIASQQAFSSPFEGSNVSPRGSTEIIV
jgi:hypothetical protein